jgi:glycosyltransferase involved in cell wall biosynthesis
MKDRPLRVGIVETAGAITGGLVSALNATKALEDRVEFFWISPPNPSLRARVQRWEPIEIPMPRRQLRAALTFPSTLATQSVRLARWVRRHRLDLLHVNDFHNLLGVAARPLLRSTPLVYHVRLMPDAYLRPVWKPMVGAACAAADRVICVSRAVQRSVPWATEVLHDGAPVPSTPRGPAAPQGQPLRVLVLSHFIPGKGQDLALEAFRLAHARAPQLRLSFVGGDLGLPRNQAFRARLQGRVRDLGLDHVVDFSPFASDPGDAYRSADILLNLSESESFSMVCLEGLLHRVPLVASDCGGPRELFEHLSSGLLVPNRGVQEAADALVQLAGDRELRERLGSEGRAQAARRFAIEHTSARLLAVYNELTGRA